MRLPCITQDAFDRVGADDRVPRVGFRQFMRDTLLAPGGVCLLQRDDLVCDRQIDPGRLVGG
jgi:hypothetical protein